MGCGGSREDASLLGTFLPRVREYHRAPELPVLGPACTRLYCFLPEQEWGGEHPGNLNPKRIKPGLLTQPQPTPVHQPAPWPRRALPREGETLTYHQVHGHHMMAEGQSPKVQVVGILHTLDGEQRLLHRPKLHTPRGSWKRGGGGGGCAH